MENNSVILEMHNVKKNFGATQALKGVDLKIHAGEVHAIVGSNGAGKSTLMKTLAGEHIPTEGKIFLDGQDITGKTPMEIQNLGVEVVHQVLNVLDSMTILENIMLSKPPLENGLLKWSKGIKEVEEVLEFLGVDFDIDQTVGSLSVSEKQFVVLARALIKKPRILVFDEPTSRISLEETRNLFRVINKLRQDGITMIYISHRMEEIYEITDRISVFRDGRHVLTEKTTLLDEDTLVAEMLGQKLEAFFPKETVAISEGEEGKVLTIENLQFKEKVNDVSFHVRRGEIVSLVGAVGAGKTEILNLIYGLDKADSGHIRITDKDISSKNAPQKSIRNGIAFVPEDRKQHGMINNYSIKNNMTSINMKNIINRGLLDPKKESTLAQGLNDRLGVHPNDIEYAMKDLSGGNQQKIVLGKWLTDDYHLYLLDEVAAGVDVGAKSEIYSLLGTLVKKGAGVLLSTGDIEEALGLSDRIVVLYKGKIVAEVTPSTTSKDELLTYIMGGGKSE